MRFWLVSWQRSYRDACQAPSHPENPMGDTATLTALAMMAAIVYLTRAGGYLIGIQLRHIPGIKPLLETLPGCAMMAILAPAVWQGTLTEIISLSAVLVLMWTTNSVILAATTGILILLFLPL